MINLKPEIVIEDLLNIEPDLGIVFYTLCSYAKTHKLPVLVTSIMSDKVEGRVSDTHKEGRGLDCSVRGWSEFHIERVCYHLNNKFKDWGTGKANIVALYHKTENGAYHIHLQVRRELLW